MALFLNSVQCFFIGIIIFGFIGFLQGWKRMLVVSGFTIVTVLFLFIGGAGGTAHYLFVSGSQIIGIATNGALGAKPGATPPNPNSTEILISALVAIGFAMLLGFFIAARAFPPEKIGNITFTAHTRDRFIGILPGIATGYAVISYISHQFASSPSITLGFNTPSQEVLGSYIAILFTIAIIAIVIGLLTARFGK
jgi:hypothetical protein